ncbi:hypothetical protein BB560_004749 [Smittium megazygosporum]|uniref:DNA excision repair protein ERCC-1 n=1 Tax=Smittium megazygosporum TaxID=133381 RepID=A0A2T9Z8C8_9FUNG|nr:hypothetical protein BB560_004749 [Smittium megazygosporum]
MNNNRNSSFPGNQLFRNNEGSTNSISISTFELPHKSRKSIGALLVNPVQRDNPVLKAIQSTPYQFEDIAPDYVVGKSACVLYLSLKYHKLYPEYIYRRIEELSGQYDLRILLILVDTNDHEHLLREITKATVYANITIILAWTIQEAARSIETLKKFENKPPDMIKTKHESDFMSNMAKSLTQIRSINKTDVLTLTSEYGSFSGISKASVNDLALLPGIGDNKAKKLFAAFNDDFIIKKDK